MLGDEVCSNNTNQRLDTSFFFRLIWFNLKSFTRSLNSTKEEYLENFLTSYTKLETHEQNSFDFLKVLGQPKLLAPKTLEDLMDLMTST